MGSDHKPTILNVDDSEPSRYIRTRVLTQAGFRTREAASGTEALAAAQAELPDLVLLDVNLPDINGLEVCQRLKREPQTSAVPVIQISAEFRDDQSRIAGLERGADAYLAEPVAPELLVSTVRSLLRFEEIQEGRRREAVSTADYLGRIHGISAALAQALTTDAVLDTIRDRVLAGTCAGTGYIVLLAEGGRELVPARVSGCPPEIAARLQTISLEAALPVTDAIRSGQVILVEDNSRTPQHPELAELGCWGTGGAVAAVPLAVQDRMLGAIGLRFSEPRGFTDQDREFFATVGRECAQALDRARLYDDERRLRKELEHEIEERRRAEADLRASERRFRALSEAALEGIAIHDGERILDANGTFARMFGYAPGEVVGRGPAEFIAPELREQAVRTNMKQFGQPYESVGLRKDGSTFPVEFIGRRIEYGGREVRVGVVRDLTEQKRAEEALRESEQRYRVLFESLQEGYAIGEIIRDASGEPVDWRYLNVNPAFESMFGRRRDEVVGHTYRELFPDAPWEYWVAELGKVALTGGPAHLEKYGHERGRHYQAFAYSPRIGQFAAIFSDITEQKRVEEALRESDRRYSALFSNRINAIAHCKVITDRDGTPVDYEIVEVNAAYESITGIAKADIEGKRARQVFPAIEHSSFDYIEHFGKIALEGGELSLDALFEPLGLWLSVYAYSPKRGEFVAMFTNVTERKRAEQALQESEERYRTLFTSMSEGFAVGELIPAEDGAPIDYRIVEINGAFEHETGLGRDILGRPMREVLPNSEPVWIDVYGRVALTGEPARFEQYNRDTGRHYSVFCYSPSRGRFAVLFRDITERKRAENALRESERQFRELADSMPQLVWITDATGYVLFFNRRWQEQLGIPLEQSLGHKWAEVLHPEDRDRALNVWLNCVKTGEDYETEYRFRTALGDYRWFLARGVPVRDEQGRITGWYGTCTDIEDRKRAEDRLRQTQKLESIGLLAGGIAHDFNNLLVGIMGNASLAENMLPPEHPVSDLLGKVVKTSGHAAHLVKQLLAYSGQGQFVIEAVDLSELVEEISDLVQPSISKKVIVQLDLERQLPPVQADRSQMQQVFTNLILNASEAIGDRAGLISVRTGVEEVDEQRRSAEPEYADLLPGRYVYLEVRDTGPGMDEGTKARIFDPFFTTKFTGRGLGLPAVSGIVRGHKGATRVETAAGKGACFKVLLPAASGGAQFSLQAAPASEELQGSGTVLVVDDEEEIRQTAQQILERYGYEVLLAHDGPSAIELFKTVAPRAGVVVLDLSMPGMSGHEVLPELQKIRPDVRVVISSGYNEAEVLRQFTGTRVAGFIQKPYTVRQLAGKVKEAMPQLTR